MNPAVRIVDTSLRDGSHAKSHQFTLEMIEAVAGGLDRVGIPYIEVSHGDGLGGASLVYGFPLFSDEERLEVAHKVIKRAKLTVLCLPGIGTRKDLEMAAENGAKVARICTHCTEANISAQQISQAKDLGMEVMTFLMMCHMISPEELLEQAKLMEGYGADVVYATDSAGACTPQMVKDRISLLSHHLGCEVGFHAHNNLGLAIGNSLIAVENGAQYIDGTVRGIGAGAGNAMTEVLVAALERAGYKTGIDLLGLIDFADNIFAPIMDRPQIIDGSSLILGYAGVYSSFLLHTFRAAEKFNVDPRQVLIRLGELKTVGGQEDMIVDVAYQLAQEKKK
ncbi:MAG TPA: 4-hydroxy-2-oxovalerate aldolase [Methanomassiliicoccales archaeon]|nr:4-hydroxy-2-oxovalerate aldolase [Methanomassiliicoccales archaeon]